LATGHYQQSVGSNFNIAIAQQTVSKYLPEICNAIEAIAPQWIQFSVDEERKQRIKEKFMLKFGFPGIIGVIDGTQVRISEPEEDEHIYFNRKGYHSKNIQIIQILISLMLMLTLVEQHTIRSSGMPQQ